MDWTRRDVLLAAGAAASGVAAKRRARTHAVTLDDSGGAVASMNWQVTIGTSTGSPFVSRSGATLYRHGQPFVFGAGVNLYYAAARQPLVGVHKALGSNNGYLATALSTLDTLSGGKIKVVRFWAYQNLAVTSGVRDWAPIDQVFAVAGSMGFLVIPVLADEWGDVGEGGVTKTSTWFTNDYANVVATNDTVTYRAWVAEITARYRNEPSILMWEFGNELSPYADTSGTLLDDTVGFNVNKAWAKDVADVVRANDTNHLMCNGLNYNNSGTKNYTTSYEDIIAYDGTDVFSYHDYSGDANNTTVGTEVTDLVNLRSKAAAANRPFIVGEVGVHITAGASRPTDYDGKLTRYAITPSGFGSSPYVGALPWVWNDTVDYRGAYASIDSLYDIRPDVDAASVAVLTAHGSTLP